MRLTLALTLLAGLLLAPLAAAAPNAHASKGMEHAADAAHAAEDASGKPAAASEWRSALKSLLTSWHENATSIRESCHAAQKPGENATGEEHASWAHCIRDGYKAFLAELRADMKQARLARGA